MIARIRAARAARRDAALRAEAGRLIREARAQRRAEAMRPAGVTLDIVRPYCYAE